MYQAQSTKTDVTNCSGSSGTLDRHWEKFSDVSDICITKQMASSLTVLSGDLFCYDLI